MTDFILSLPEELFVSTMCILTLIITILGYYILYEWDRIKSRIKIGNIIAILVFLIGLTIIPSAIFTRTSLYTNKPAKTIVTRVKTECDTQILSKGQILAIIRKTINEYNQDELNTLSPNIIKLIGDKTLQHTNYILHESIQKIVMENQRKYSETTKIPTKTKRIKQ